MVIDTSRMDKKMMNRLPPDTNLGLRDWLELGQAMVNKSRMSPIYFRKYETTCISIGKGIKIKANGKWFKSGRYFLDENKK